MFSIRLSSAIQSLVEVMLPIGSEHGLFIMCDLRLEIEKYKLATSKDVGFSFYRPTNYTKVFVAESDRWIEPEASAFVLTSDHDSCWRSDGVDSVISRYYFEMAKSIQGKKEIAPKDMWEFVNFHEIKLVKVEVDRVRDESYGPNVSSTVAHLVSYEDMP